MSAAIETTDDLLAELARLEDEIAEAEASQVRKAATDFGDFVEFVLRDEKTGARIKLASMHHIWISFVALCWKLRVFPWILAPFGSGKSQIFPIALPLYALGHDQSLRIKVISANDDIARERLGSIRQYIEGSEAYHQVFPHVLPDYDRGWTQHRMFLKRSTIAKDPSIHALGAMTSKGVGGRSDLNLYDDLNDMKNTVLEPRMRAKLWQMYTTIFHSRLEAAQAIGEGKAAVGKGVGIMTRWHQYDIYGYITKDPSMLQQYGFLIQSISDDMRHLNCEILIGQPVEGLSPDAARKPVKGSLDLLLYQYERGLFGDGT